MNKMNNEKSKTIFLDTNTFYLFLNLFGYNFTDIDTNYDFLDSTKLKNEFVTLLQENRIGFSTNMIFEVISHFRNNKSELKRLLNHLQNVFGLYNSSFRIDKAEPRFVYKNNTDRDVKELFNCNISQATINAVVKAKIESESAILSSTIYYIALSFIVTKYFICGNFKHLAKPFADSMKFNDFENIKIIKESAQNQIKTQLHIDYQLNKEKKSFRKIFSDVLNNSVCMMLIQLDAIKNKLDNTPNNTFFYNDLFGTNETEKIEIILHNIQKNYSTFKLQLVDFITDETSALQKLDYTKCQQIYIFQVIEDLFNNSTKMDKNDAPDFWMLHLSSHKGYLLTFDKQMINSIKQGFPKNYNYIKNFYR